MPSNLLNIFISPLESEKPQSIAISRTDFPVCTRLSLAALTRILVRNHYTSPNGDLGHVFHCNLRLPEAAQCNDDEVEFFRQYALA